MDNWEVIPEVYYQKYINYGDCEKKCEYRCIWCSMRNDSFSCFCDNGWYNFFGNNVSNYRHCIVTDEKLFQEDKLVCSNCILNAKNMYECQVWLRKMLKSGFDMKEPATYNDLESCQSDCYKNGVNGSCYCGELIGSYGCECFFTKSNNMKPKTSKYPYRTCPSDCCAFCTNCKNKSEYQDTFECDCWHDQYGRWDFIFNSPICSSFASYKFYLQTLNKITFSSMCISYFIYLLF